jgi:hypothetical protein
MVDSRGHRNTSWTAERKDGAVKRVFGAGLGFRKTRLSRRRKSGDEGFSRLLLGTS